MLPEVSTDGDGKLIHRIRLKPMTAVAVAALLLALVLVYITVSEPGNAVQKGITGGFAGVGFLFFYLTTWGRGRLLIGDDFVELRGWVRRRRIRIDEVAHVFRRDPFAGIQVRGGVGGAAIAAQRGYSLWAAGKPLFIQDEWVTAGGSILEEAMTKALAAAVERARTGLDGGAPYWQPDQFAGFDGHDLHGTDLRSRKRAAAPLTDVAEVRGGDAFLRGGEARAAFCIGNDPVLNTLLDEHGVVRRPA